MQRARQDARRGARPAPLWRWGALTCALIAACSDTTPPPLPAPAAPPPPRPLRFGATPLSAPLAERLMQVAWEGVAEALPLNARLDGAEEALDDGVIDGAFALSAAAPTARHREVARSEVWWATRGPLRQLTAEEWLHTLTADPRATPPRLQPCFRAEPDPIEAAWAALNPTLAAPLRAARRSGRWPVFYEERRLLEHLELTPSAVALVDAARLRLYGLPLAALRLEGAREAFVSVWFRGREGGEPALARWRSFLSDGAQVSWARDLGWLPPASALRPPPSPSAEGPP